MPRYVTRFADRRIDDLGVALRRGKVVTIPFHRSSVSTDLRDLLNLGYVVEISSEDEDTATEPTQTPKADAPTNAAMNPPTMAQPTQHTEGEFQDLRSRVQSLEGELKSLRDELTKFVTKPKLRGSRK